MSESGRIAAMLDECCRMLCPRFPWDHDEYVGPLVLVMAFAWEERSPIFIGIYMSRSTSAISTVSW